MDIEVSDLKHDTVHANYVANFSGGLVGVRVVDGWALAPLRREGDIRMAGPYSMAQLEQIANQCQCRLVGWNEVIDLGGAAPSETWRSALALRERGLGGADRWGAIAYQAQAAGDMLNGDAALYFSTCLQAAGIRLRDVAQHHHRQLIWALKEDKRAGEGFSNMPIHDLYLDFHSLASELCSARDHLARIAAFRVGAKASVESLARLDDWVRKPVNAGARDDALVALLMEALGTDEHPAWLRQLGEVRNQMLHRQPLAANPQTAMLRLSETNTAAGSVMTIRLSPTKWADVDLQQAADPLVTLLDLYDQMELLARRASLISVYPADLPVFRTT